jgi:four helix bundle protein
MYSTKPNLVIGFHGCEEEDRNRLINEDNFFKRSCESYDWLGHGMYFWDNNLDRARYWAELKKKAGTLTKPAVVGAVIDLGYCLDLLDSRNIDILKKSYKLLNVELSTLGKELPETKRSGKIV